MSDLDQPKKFERSFWHTISLASPGKRFWGRLIVAILFTLPIVAYFASSMLMNVMNTINMLKLEDPALASNLIYQLRSIGFLFLGVIIMLCLLGIYFVFFVSVQVYGPQVALILFITQLKNGDYRPFRALRKDDQLKEIWGALQDLADEMRRKG